jgi:hypothetical protein
MAGWRNFTFLALFLGGASRAAAAEERVPLWVKSFRRGGDATAGAGALAIDPAGGVLVAGHSGTDGDLDLVVVKYDAVLLSYLFQEGAAPPCLAACNFDGGARGSLSVVDAVYLLRHAFLGGPPPPAPFPSCGPGTAGDERLGCARAGCGPPR